VTTVDGVAVIRLHDDGEGRSLKNDDSRRTAPLRLALIAEGFLQYDNALPARSPLFPDLPVDGVIGRRSLAASKRLGRWLRSVGITDPQISPAHSWRHWFIGAARRATMPPEVRSAITGHSAKIDESAGHGEGMKAFVLVLAENMPPIPAAAQANAPGVPEAAPDHQRSRRRRLSPQPGLPPLSL
jgi:hypothetical protein